MHFTRKDFQKPENSTCTALACPKQHSRFCYFRFTFGNCKFGNDCKYLHNTPEYTQSPPIVVEMMGNLEEVKCLKTEIEILKEETILLKERKYSQRKSSASCRQKHRKTGEGNRIKDKNDEQFSDKLLTVKNTLNNREHVIMELKHALDLSGNAINTLKQHIKDHGDIDGSLTSVTILTSSTKKPPKLKCKYCGKKFSLP